MGVPIIYRKSSENTVAYDFLHIANGTGIVQYYGASISGAYVLVNENTYSDKVLSIVTPGTGAYTKLMDFDFDTIIASPTTFMGTASINVPAYASIGATSTQFYVIATIRKWDGTTETDIVSAQSSIITATVGSADHDSMILLRLTVPKTKFKRGETLRITIEGWGKSNSGGKYVYIAHDPKGRSGNDPAGYWLSSYATTMLFNMPVRIDL